MFNEIMITLFSRTRSCKSILFRNKIEVALKRADWCDCPCVVVVYLELVYLVTALVPSLTACLASSPGSRRRTAVWISRLVIVERRL